MCVPVPNLQVPQIVLFFLGTPVSHGKTNDFELNDSKHFPNYSPLNIFVIYYCSRIYSRAS
jgi:hypothetical protein